MTPQHPAAPETEEWECGPHSNAWGGHDARCRKIATACCACTSVAVARVLDGAFRKPVCVAHRRLYAESGHLIDSLAPTGAER